MANVVRILIAAKDEVSTELDKIRDKASLLAKTDLGKGMVTGAGIAAFGMLRDAVGGVTDILGDAVKAGMEEEESIAKLATSLRANVAGWDGNTDAIERTMKAQLALGFSDEEQRDSLSRLVAVTHDVGKSMSMMRTAMDLSRFRGISLAEATQALTNIEGGRYKALGQLIGSTKEITSSTQAMAAVQAVAAGQAEDYANTTTGKLLVAQTKMGEKMDELGARLIPVVSGALDAAVGALDRYSAGADKAADGSLSLIDRLSGLGDVWNTVNPMAWGFNASMDDLRRKAAAAEAETARTADATRSASASWDHGSASLGSFGESAAVTHDNLQPLPSLVHGLGREAGTTAYKLDAMADALDRVAQKAGDDQYSISELKHQFALNADQIQENIDKIRELQRVKHPTAAQRADLEQTQLALIGNKREAIALGEKMLAAGQIKYPALIKEFGKLGVSLYNADGTANDLLRTLRLISGNSEPAPGAGSKSTAGGQRKRAAGGFIPPYGEALVGELGPEVIRLGSAGAHVSPSASGWSAGWQQPAGGTVVNIGGVHVSGFGSDVGPAAARRLAQQTLDAVAMGLREQTARYARGSS